MAQVTATSTRPQMESRGHLRLQTLLQGQPTFSPCLPSKAALGMPWEAESFTQARTACRGALQVFGSCLPTSARCAEAGDRLTTVLGMSGVRPSILVRQETQKERKSPALNAPIHPASPPGFSTRTQRTSVKCLNP